MTCEELTRTDQFCVLFERQYGYVFRRLGSSADMTFTADPKFFDVVRQADEHWGRFEAQVHTSSNDARGPSTGIFCVHIRSKLKGLPEVILEGARFSV